MKIGFVVSRVILAFLLVAMVLTVIGIPLSMTFTANDMSPSMGFFVEILMEFLMFAPFFLMLIVPGMASENFFRYKLGMLEEHKFKKRVCVYAACELVLLVMIIIIIVYADRVSRGMVY